MLANVPVQRALGDNINLATEQILEIGKETTRKKRRYLLPWLDKQIYIALRVSLAARHRAKQTDVARSMPRRNLQNLLPFLLHQRCYVHNSLAIVIVCLRFQL